MAAYCSTRPAGQLRRTLRTTAIDRRVRPLRGVVGGIFSLTASTRTDRAMSCDASATDGGPRH